MVSEIQQGHWQVIIEVGFWVTVDSSIGANRNGVPQEPHMSVQVYPMYVDAELKRVSGEVLPAY